MRLSHLVVLERPEPDLMRRVAQEALDYHHPGLPSHMRLSIRYSAEMVLTLGGYADYLYLCLIAVQARPQGEPAEVIRLRQELESIFFHLLFGGPA